MSGYIPPYRKLLETGELKKRVELLRKKLRSCTLCPHNCEVDRTAGEKGICGAPADLYISSAFPHFGEEAPLVGRYGSGTIFFTHCNLKCGFCQNYDISHFGEGRKISTGELADIMISLERNGCHNINIVTPTHYVPQLVEGLMTAAERDLKLPLVYNCGGYESVDTLKLLDEIVDIYMPDAKFASDKTGKKYTKAGNYFTVMKDALKEMHRQTGVLKTDASGIAYRGVLIRHLIMPNNVAGSEVILKFIAEELSKDSYVNVMAQYRPLHNACDYKEINRTITRSELKEALKIAGSNGLHRGFDMERHIFLF